MRNQPTANPRTSTTEKPLTEKKARREAKKQQIKMEKKANKQKIK